MAISDEITRLQNDSAAIAAAIAAKGVTVPSGSGYDDYASLIGSIQQGSTPSLQNKTVTPTTSQQSVTADSGYDGLGTVTVNSIQTETKTATPTTSSQNIDATSGKYMTRVTVSAIQTETKTATPSTSQQTVTPTSGKFLTQVTVSAVTSSIDANITAGNIKSGTTILGVTGNYTGGSATVATTTKTVGSSNASSLAFTVSGQPKMFAVQLSLASSGSYLTNSSTSTYLVSSVIGDGSNVYTTACRYNSSGTRAAREYYYTTGSKSYSNGTFTVTAGNGYFAANQTYRLIYVC